VPAAHREPEMLSDRPRPTGIADKENTLDCLLSEDVHQTLEFGKADRGDQA